MAAILKFFVENKQLLIYMGILIVALSLSGNITATLRSAKNGLKEAVTPLGFLVLLGIIYIIYLVYLKVEATL